MVVGVDVALGGLGPALSGEAVVARNPASCVTGARQTQRIVIGIDGSARARRASESAAAQARVTGVLLVAGWERVAPLQIRVPQERRVRGRGRGVGARREPVHLEMRYRASG